MKFQTIISKAIINLNKNNILSPIESVTEKLLTQHKENIYKMYMGYVHRYFSDEPFQGFYNMSEVSFLKTANIEVEQQTKYIKSQVKLEIFA